LYARRGQIVDLGKGAYLEVLSPDRDVFNVDPNVGCIVTRLVYGETAFMLPCDATTPIEKYLAQLDGSALASDVLKAGHHGSDTSSSELFVGYVDPAYVVFSRGCDNRYGHPHEEVVERFKRFEIQTLDTCEDGTITFVSDGSTVRKR
jgi:competence protein ComEC